MDTKANANDRGGDGAGLRFGRWPEEATVWASAAAVACCAAAFAAANPMFATDVACRYAPMAEAFASGEWAEAFHPRFGVGMSAAAGLLRMASGLDGYAACSAVSAFAWGLGVAPVYAIARAVFGRREACFAALLYLICPQPLLWGLKGLREPFKMLGVLLMADGLLRRTAGAPFRGGAWQAAAGVALLVLFKCDAILLGGLLCLAYAAADRFRWRTWVVWATGLAALQPMCALVHSWTGVWVPASQYVTVWRRIFGG